MPSKLAAVGGRALATAWHPTSLASESAPPMNAAAPLESVLLAKRLCRELHKLSLMVQLALCTANPAMVILTPL